MVKNKKNKNNSNSRWPQTKIKPNVQVGKLVLGVSHGVWDPVTKKSGVFMKNISESLRLRSPLNKKLFVAAKGKSFADVGGGTNRYDGDSDTRVGKNDLGILEEDNEASKNGATTFGRVTLWPVTLSWNSYRGRSSLVGRASRIKAPHRGATLWCEFKSRWQHTVVCHGDCVKNSSLFENY